MRCYEENRPASSGGVSEDRVRESAAVGREGVNQTVSTHATSRLPPPLLRQAAHASLTPPRGLSRYVQGLAAGEDLADLIRGLRSTMNACYQDCMRGDTTRSAAASASPPASSYDSVKRGVCAGGLPTTPHPLPRGAFSAAQRGDFFAATKTALLFAAESASATEEATILHCSAVTRSLLFPYYYPTGQVGGVVSSDTALPFSSALRRGEMRMILSDVRMVELAREAVRHRPRDGWQEALQLLHQVAPTPLTSAVEVELYRQTGGHHWAEALRCLWTIPTPQWTEMDVGAVLRCLYHAGRRYAAKAEPADRSISSSSPADDTDALAGGGGDGASTGDVFLARLIAQALRVHRAVEETGTIQWSTPSAFNDTLGLVAQDPSAWRDACLLLDKLLAAQHSSSASAESAHTAENTAAAAQSPRTPLGVTSAAASSALYRLVRPNAVTVHQTCRALQRHWETGLRYVQLLQTTSSESIELVKDIAATEDVLRLCIAGQRWQEALSLVQARSAVFASSQAITATSSHSASAARPVVAAELASERRHYRPDVFVQLVRLLGTVPEARPTAYALVQAHETAATATRAAPSLHGGAEAAAAATSVSFSSSVDLGRSKHYNRDTLSRAYNCLIQGSATLQAADAVVQQLRQHPGSDKGLGKSALPAHITTTAAEEHEQMLTGLETESVAHIAYLSCVAGSWERALHHTNALLHAPRYQATFLPTSRLHDAVQYALEQAPAPGPPWEASLRLFTDMMDRNVPNSEVAFKSAVKRCFAGGAPEQAQRLFHLLLKTGVRS